MIKFYYEKLLLKDAIESCFIKTYGKRKLKFWSGLGIFFQG